LGNPSRLWLILLPLKNQIKYERILYFCTLRFAAKAAVALSSVVMIENGSRRALSMIRLDLEQCVVRRNCAE
jgi:hypothetical protein